MLPPSRYAVLDSYRFIAALGIVAYHFGAHFAPFRGQSHAALPGLQTLVDFFFVLSGFVLAHTYGSGISSVTAYRDFLRKRFARIYPLHAATLALCVALFVFVRLTATPVRDTSIIDMSVLLPNLLLVQAWGVSDHIALNSPSWSISAEAFVYLLFPLFMLLTRRLKSALTIALAVGAAILIEVARRSAGLRPGGLATFDYGMLRAVPMFLSGIAVHAFVVARPLASVPWHVPHALSGLILALMVLEVPDAAIDLFYPLLVAVIALAERGGSPTRLASPLAVRLGQASFAIYMLHTFVQIACVGLVRRLGWTSLPALWAVAIAGTLLITLIGLVSFRFFETPARRWLSGTGNADASQSRPRRILPIGAPN